MPTGKYPNVINVFLVLTPVRVEVKRGGICYVAARLVRNNGDIVTYLALVRVALERVKRVTYSNVR